MVGCVASACSEEPGSSVHCQACAVHASHTKHTNWHDPNKPPAMQTGMRTPATLVRRPECLPPVRACQQRLTRTDHKALAVQAALWRTTGTRSAQDPVHFVIFSSVLSTKSSLSLPRTDCLAQDRLPAGRHRAGALVPLRRHCAQRRRPPCGTPTDHASTHASCDAPTGHARTHASCDAPTGHAPTHASLAHAKPGVGRSAAVHSGRDFVHALAKRQRRAALQRHQHGATCWVQWRFESAHARSHTAHGQGRVGVPANIRQSDHAS